MLIITDSGEGQLWKTVSSDLVFVAKTARSLTNATAAVWIDETLFVGLADGTIEMFSLTGEALGLPPGKNGPVRSLATEWATLAVADSAGVTFWKLREKRRAIELASKDITHIKFGSYPDIMHQTRGALLVLTADGLMTAVDASGVVK